MRQIRIPAAFIRGGTSNAIIFDEKNLPRDRGVPGLRVAGGEKLRAA